MHGFVVHLGDGVDRNQEFRLADTQEATGGDPQEADLVLAIIPSKSSTCPISSPALSSTLRPRTSSAGSLVSSLSSLMLRNDAEWSIWVIAYSFDRVA
jgi:hypothetical protein